MPKQKIKKSVTRRFRLTKNGKLMRRSSSIRHLRRNKSKAQLRDLKVVKELVGAPAKKIKRLLGK